jgi:hypothetical protein
MEDISIVKHSAAVGSVATHWALFEILLDITMWSATKLDPRIGACLTAQISGHARKLDAVIALVCLDPRYADKVTKLNKLAETARSLSEQRNRVVHDPWTAVDGKMHRMEATARRDAGWQPLCENAKALDRDRRSYSSKAVLVVHRASGFNLEIELKNIILRRVSIFEFLHSQGPTADISADSLCAFALLTDIERMARKNPELEDDRRFQCNAK